MHIICPTDTTLSVQHLRQHPKLIKICNSTIPLIPNTIASIATSHFITNGVYITYLLSSRILVDDPLIERRPPVFHQERFSILLTLAVAEATLCLRPRNQVVLLQVDLQVLPHLTADLGFRAPGTTVLLLIQSERNEKDMNSYYSRCLLGKLVRE